MSRIRSVKPNLFGSYSLKSVSIQARYLFIGLFTEADDDGRLLDSPKRIAGSLFPHDEAVTAAKVNNWLEELAKARGEDGWPCIVRYSTAGGKYISIPAWKLHQKISHALPSVLPEIPVALQESLTNESIAFLESLRNGSALNGKGN